MARAKIVARRDASCVGERDGSSGQPPTRARVSRFCTPGAPSRVFPTSTPREGSGSRR